MTKLRLSGCVAMCVMAALVGVRASFVSGGILCVIGCGACALALPALWTYEAPGRSPKVPAESGV